jgi:RNA-directed DNA polymerase
MLHELDMEMEKRQLRFVRYADDFSIYCKTRQEARTIGNNIYVFLRNKLKLPINREKSGIRRPLDFKILGYGFVPTYRKGDNLAEGDLTNTYKIVKKGVSNGKYQLVVQEKRWNLPQVAHEHQKNKTKKM